MVSSAVVQWQAWYVAGLRRRISGSLLSPRRPLGSNDVRPTLVDDLVVALNYIRKWPRMVKKIANVFKTSVAVYVGDTGKILVSS